ncbi:MAG TPA: CBS domain-containing protein [Stellaceae bacterium]|nr:CBS domain-containing protein [Stellaceae bacterium]
MKLGDIMTRPAITVGPETTIAAAAQLMVQRRISGLPVVDAAGTVVGIVTEGDLLRRAELGTERRHRRWLEFIISPGRLASEYAGAHARKVGQVMTEDVISVGPQDPLDAAVRLMQRRHVKRLPVIDGGRLVGIVSRADLVRALADELARRQAQEGDDDAAIRERILREMDRQHWAPRASVDVRVTDGVVELCGTITDERERLAMQVLAETAAGVKRVEDHLICVEPMSGNVISPEAAEPSRGSTGALNDA